VITLISVILALTACAVSPSSTPNSSQAASSAPSSVPSGAPSPTPSLITGFLFSDILAVQVNGLAVRVAPSLTSPLAQGLGANAEPMGDVRLGVGDFVSVQLGPLPIGDIVWYLVWPAEDARLGYSTLWWDTNSDDPDGGVNPGWVAASRGGDEYLTLHRRPDPAEYGGWPEGGPQALMVSGTGNYDSEPLPRHDLFTLLWAATADGHPIPCELAVNLVPEDGAGVVLAVQTSTDNLELGPTSGAGSSPNTPWGPFAGGAWDSFSISIRSECTWTVGLWPLAHD